MRGISKILILTIFCLAILPIGCENTEKKGNSIINNPDKIIVYYRGQSKEVSSKSQCFNDLIKLTNSRFEKEKLSIMKSDTSVNNEAIKTMEKTGFTALEFIYNKEQVMNVPDTNGVFEVKYYRLFFSLEDSPFMSYVSNDDKNEVFQYGDKVDYKGSPIGFLTKSEKLITQVGKIFEN